MAPNPRPIPRFIADTSQEGIASGRFAARLREAFVEAVKAIEDLPAGAAVPEEIDWSPERAWGGRVCIPCSARSESEEGTLELFGHVSYALPVGEGDATDFRATADFTDVLAEDNPDWKIDLNDDVIGRRRGETGRAGAVTLVWGRPLVRGAVAATAQLYDETVDQEEIVRDRFSLVALDALEAYGDDVFMRVKLWTRRGRERASESLYASEDEAEDPAESEA